MIKNVVFDLGQVLYRFEPMQLVQGYVECEEDRELLAAVLFDRLYWDKLDSGEMENEEAICLASKRLPERLHAAARRAFCDWIYNMPPIEKMHEVVTRVKKMGKKVYLLSNVSRYFAEHCREFEIFSCFDGLVFSGVERLMKPERAIYERLVSLTGIVPEETLFIDDNENNVKAAADFGIVAYRFDMDFEGLDAFLDKVL